MSGPVFSSVVTSNNPEVTTLPADLSDTSVEPLGGLSLSTAVIPDVTPVSAAAASFVLPEGKLSSASCEGDSEAPLAAASSAPSSAVVAEAHGGEHLSHLLSRAKESSQDNQQRYLTAKP